MLRRALLRYAAAPSGGNPNINVKPVTPSGTPVSPQKSAQPKVAEQPKAPPSQPPKTAEPKEPAKETPKETPKTAEPVKKEPKLSGTPKMGVNPSLYEEQPKAEPVKPAVSTSTTPQSSNSPPSDSSTAPESSSNDSSNSSSASEEKIQRLLTKQYETLIQMTNDIEIARGNRLAQREITGSTQIRDIPKVAQLVCSTAAATATSRAKSASGSLQSLVVEGSKSSLSNAIERRKQLSEMNRDQQLPWQKNTPRELYIKTGRWFLAQQQGTEAPVLMTALECAILLGVFVYFLLQRRKAKKISHNVDSLIESSKAEAEEAKNALENAFVTWNTQIVTKNEEIRDVQNNLFEQSCALDKFTTEVVKSA
eukprot:TRINITY_DN5518_c0_g2_i1.p1 TRINITY_DN5518_c0_g2~~TRINITY_DN5518_c0_g2_i1.p1  ORF type:complete len:366 (+),score=75.96 TRINITY_DN5518_c0_g2_i1:40-1137(+)